VRYLVLELVLAVISTVFFLAAIFFSYKLSKETGGEKYWIFFVIAAIGFSVADLASIGFFLNISSEAFFAIREIGEIVGAFSLAYATFGLYSSMKKIREKMSKELEE